MCHIINIITKSSIKTNATSATSTTSRGATDDAAAIVFDII